MIKLIKAYGAAGESAAYRWIMARNIRRQSVAPEAIWRPRKGMYRRYIRMAEDNEPTCTDIWGTSWHTATRTIADAFRRL